MHRSTRLPLARALRLAFAALLLAPLAAGAQVVLRSATQLTVLKPGPAPAAAAAATAPTVVTLRWSRVPDAVGYVVSRSINGGAYRQVGDTLADTLLVDGAVGPSTSYRYIVSARFPDEKQLGPGESTPAAVTTPAGPSPSFVVAHTSGRGKVSVSWKPVAGAAGYMVVRDNAQATTSPVRGTSFRDSVSAPGQHVYRVYAVYDVPDTPAPGQTSTVEGNLNGIPAATVNVPRWTGRYLVTINGFSVGHETYDDVLQLDGKRDEVFVAASAQLFDHRNQPRGARADVKTLVLGDVNNLPGRVQAGSESAKGGIRTGDAVPTATPWSRNATVTNDRLPLFVWSGTLTEGEDRLTVTPMVWEYDGDPDLLTSLASAWSGFYDALAERMAKIPECQTTSVAASAFDLGLTTFVNGVQGVIGSKHDRPIGMARSGSSLSFQPKTILLDFAAAEKLLATNPAGKGPGIVAVRYAEPVTSDGAALNGDYTLYLQIERLP